MTWQSVDMRGEYPRRKVWFLECDVCGHVSDPFWNQASPGLLRIAGWIVTDPNKPPRDRCPSCKLQENGRPYVYQ